MYRQATKCRRWEKHLRGPARQRQRNGASAKVPFCPEGKICAVTLSSSANEDECTHVFHRKLLAVTEGCNSDQLVQSRLDRTGFKSQPGPPMQISHQWSRLTNSIGASLMLNHADLMLVCVCVRCMLLFIDLASVGECRHLFPFYECIYLDYTLKRMPLPRWFLG